MMKSAIIVNYIKFLADVYESIDQLVNGKTVQKRQRYVLIIEFSVTTTVSILFLLLAGQINCASGSTLSSKSRVKSERNGRCKFKYSYTFMFICSYEQHNVSSHFLIAQSLFYILLYVLVIFNWITFQNDMCTTEYNWNDVNIQYTREESGVCYTAAECSQQGGVAKSHCAAGYGSCCVCK